MIYTKIGDMLVSKIALGTSGSGTSTTASTESINSRMKLYRDAIDLGVNIFDTAEIYGGGFAEKVLGRALSGLRKNVFISSKFNPNHISSQSIINAAESSLIRLKTDYIDLYQMHWPNPELDMSIIAEAISALLNDGKIKYFGVSNFSFQELVEIQNYIKPIPITGLECHYNVSEKDIELDILPYCSQHKINILAYSPLGQGKLISRLSKTSLLNKLCDKYSVTTSQLILNWFSLKKGVIPIVRTKNIDHLWENINSFEFEIELSDHQMLDNALRVEKINIDCKNIVIEEIDRRVVYKSKSQAIANKLNWIPSPSLISSRIVNYNVFEPIKLIRCRIDNREEKYKLDPYDFLGEVKKYWGWVLARGLKSEIPAILTDTIEARS